MARQRRLNDPGSYHHITARGVDRCAVFRDDHDRRQFLSLLKESQARFGCRILAFCLMSNHIHLTIRDDRGSLSRMLHFVSGVYAKRFNHKHGRTGHLFERRFWSSMLDSDAYLVDCVAYVHRNPLEAGIVQRPEDYRWSSYQSYIGACSPPGFLDTSIVRAHYGNNIGLLRTATERPPQDTLLARQLQATNPPVLLGVRATLLPTNDRSFAGSAGRDKQPVPIGDILEACAAAFGLSGEEITRSAQGKSSPARGVAVFVAQRHAGHSLKDIAVALNFGSTAAVSIASRRCADSKRAQTQASIDLVLEALGLHQRTC